MEQNSWQIVVGQRGWVWVGQATREGDYLKLTTSTTVREWGTTGTGIETLAVDGPQSGTQLGGAPVTRRTHVLAVVDMIEIQPAAAAKWAKRLEAQKAKK